MTVRPPTAAEWPAVVALVERAGLPTSDLAPSHAPRFLIAARDGRLIGCVAVERYGAWGLLRSLAVAVGERGRGTGGALLEAAEARAHTDGLTHLALLTTTAAGFFRSRGWLPRDRGDLPEAVRQSSEVAGICPASAVCLGRRLEGKPASPP